MYDPLACHQALPLYVGLGLYVQIGHVDGQQRTEVGVAEHLYQGRIGLQDFPFWPGTVDAYRHAVE